MHLDFLGVEQRAARFREGSVPGPSGITKIDGDDVGNFEGDLEGNFVGLLVGLKVMICGWGGRSIEGFFVGIAEGWNVGCGVGSLEGGIDGNLLG